MLELCEMLLDGIAASAKPSTLSAGLHSVFRIRVMRKGGNTQRYCLLMMQLHMQKQTSGSCEYT